MRSGFDKRPATSIRSLELEALLRGRWVRAACIERAHAEGVAAGREVLVGLGRSAAREVRLWLLVLLRLDERALESFRLAARLELERGAPLRRVDRRLGDLRVRQEEEPRRDRPLRRHLDPAAALARARARPAGEPGAFGGSRRERDQPSAGEAERAGPAAVDAGGGARH